MKYTNEILIKKFGFYCITTYNSNDFSPNLSITHKDGTFITYKISDFYLTDNYISMTIADLYKSNDKIIDHYIKICRKNKLEALNEIQIKSR